MVRTTRAPAPGEKGAQERLVAAIERRRVREGLTVTALSARLGLSERGWTFVRDFRHRIGVKFLRGVVGAFPDLEPEVVIFLRATGSKMPVVAEYHTEAAV